MYNSTRFDLERWRQGLADLGYRPSKAQAASLLGIDAHTYDRYEKEGRVPKYIQLSCLAINLGVV